jgi:hypothetical protein
MKEGWSDSSVFLRLLCPLVPLVVRLVALWFLRGERGCDGSHSRATRKGYPVTWMSSREIYRQVSAGMELNLLGFVTNQSSGTHQLTP